MDTGEDRMALLFLSTPCSACIDNARHRTSAPDKPGVHQSSEAQFATIEVLGRPPRRVRAEAATGPWTEDRPATRADAEHRHEITGARTGTMLTTVWLGSAVYTAVIGGIAALFYSS